ncbi:MAG: ethylbenzene dehydrogenase-related protein, partial [Planctomycetota bacterium]
MRAFWIGCVIGLAPILVAACDGGQSAPAESERPAAVALLSAAPLPDGASIKIDGTRTEQATWASAPELRLKLTGDGPAEVSLRALYSDKRLYVLAQWRDKEQSLGRYWRYNEDRKWELHQTEDAFSILWAPGSHAKPFREAGCAMYCHDGGAEFRTPGPAGGNDSLGLAHAMVDRRGLADVWYWGAQRTNSLHVANDSMLRDGPPPRIQLDGAIDGSGTIANENQAFRGPAFVPRRLTPPEFPEQRFLKWSNAQSLTPEKLTRFTPDIGWQVSYDVLQHSRGSRADVNARGRFHKTGWILEMTRKL